MGTFLFTKIPPKQQGRRKNEKSKADQLLTFQPSAKKIQTSISNGRSHFSVSLQRTMAPNSNNLLKCKITRPQTQKTGSTRIMTTPSQQSILPQSHGQDYRVFRSKVANE